MTAAIHPDDFRPFFEEVHGCDPFPWQDRLARRVSDPGHKEDWPATIAIPTGGGKTACIDIAVFALAAQAHLAPAERTARRRIVLCVDRRVIVSEAFVRARRLARHLESATDGTVSHRIARALQRVAGDVPGRPPLDVFELRGGIPRDERWIRSTVQPTVIASTVDQLGSRLLFRGYGVSPQARPIHAALLAYDCLVLLDEAHISRPFMETLESVRAYADGDPWAESSVGVPGLRFTSMTATPVDQPAFNEADSAVRLSTADREHAVLGSRIRMSKPARLRREAGTSLQKPIVRCVRELIREQPALRRLAVVVNRVASAKEIAGELRRELTAQADVELVIGSMRPLDREDQFERLRKRLATGTAGAYRLLIVVATQCIEVGADYDFDALVTEASSIDSLRQRFGRVARGGDHDALESMILIRDKDAVAPEKLDEHKPRDPIYGNAIARTWAWLEDHAEGDRIDFGIAAMDERVATCDAETLAGMHGPLLRRHSPVMLPAHLDAWCQTSPAPAVEPDVSLFLRGVRSEPAEVLVCWRADLDRDDPESWRRHVEAMPPRSLECMPVPFSRVLRWWSGEDAGSADTADTPAAIVDQPHQDVGGNGSSRPPGLIWNDDEGQRTRPRPGDTIVVPAASGGWDVLGYIPHAEAAESSGPVDVADLAGLRVTRRARLRVWADRFPVDPATGASIARPILEAVRDPDQAGDARLAAELLRALHAATPAEHPSKSVLELMAADADQVRIVQHDADRGWCLLELPGRLSEDRVPHAEPVPTLDDRQDRESLDAPGGRPTLESHHDDVATEVIRTSRCLGLPVDLASALEVAARTHDLGKADDRFQALLRGMSPTEIRLLRAASGDDLTLLAKSPAEATVGVSPDRPRARSHLPRGFRHELLSVQLLDLGPVEGMPSDERLVQLIRHLVATHHGRCRPLAPVVEDPDPPTVTVRGRTLETDDRMSAVPDHRLDSDHADRFWELVRRFGWWGLCYMEAVLRLADWQASSEPDDNGAKETRHG